MASPQVCAASRPARPFWPPPCCPHPSPCCPLWAPPLPLLLTLCASHPFPHPFAHTLLARHVTPVHVVTCQALPITCWSHRLSCSSSHPTKLAWHATCVCPSSAFRLLLFMLMPCVASLLQSFAAWLLSCRRIPQSLPACIFKLLARVARKESLQSLQRLCTVEL